MSGWGAGAAAARAGAGGCRGKRPAPAARGPAPAGACAAARRGLSGERQRRRRRRLLRPPRLRGGCREAAAPPRPRRGEPCEVKPTPPRLSAALPSLPFPARPGLAGQLQSSVAPGGGAPHGPAHPLCSSPRSRRRLAFLPTNLMGGRRPPRFARLKKAGVAAPPTNKGSPCRCAFPLAAGRSARRRWPHQDGGSGQRSGVCRGEADLQPGPGRGEAAREGAVPGLVPGGAQRG